MILLVLILALINGCAFSIGGTSYSDDAKEHTSSNECGCSGDALKLSQAFGMKGPDERRSLAEAYKLCIENCRLRCQKEKP